MSLSSFPASAFEISLDPEGYIPLILEDAHTIRYRVATFFAFLTVLLYDHALTLDVEIEAIWRVSWRLPQYLFLINRYIVPPMLTFNAIVYATTHLSESFCYSFIRWQLWPNLISLTTVELILILRVSAIYWNNKILLRCLLGLFVCEFAVLLTVIVVIYAASIEIVPTLGILPGCVAVVSAYHLAFGTSIAPLVVESVLLILTISRVISLIIGYGRHNPTLRLLARDSMFYFFIMFSVLLANVIVLKVVKLSSLGSILLGPSNAVACIAVGRMMLNMRDLPIEGCVMDSEPQMSTNFSVWPSTRAEESGVSSA